MIQQHTELKIQLMPEISRFDSILDLLDQLHTAASEGNVRTLAQMNDRELVSFLQDVIYTAQETIAEIDSQKANRKPVLQIVEKQVG